MPITTFFPSGGGGGGGIVGPRATIYIEPPAPAGRGNDATGVRGDAALPFATLDAAIAVMLSGDTLKLASGVYAAPSAPFPASLEDGAIVGPSPAQCQISTSVPGATCFDFSSNARRSLWNIEGVRFGSDTGAALIADGTACPAGQFFTNGSLSFNFCTMVAGTTLLRYVGTAAFNVFIDVTGNTFTIDTCGLVFFVDGLVFAPSTYTFDGDADDLLNPNGPGIAIAPVRFNGGTVFSGGTIVLEGQGGVYSAPGSVLPAISTGAMTVSVGGDTSEIALFGNVESAVLSLNNATTDVDLQGSSWNGNLSISAIGGFNSTRVNAIGCTFGGTVTIGEGVLAILRGASFASDILTVLTTTGSPGSQGVVPPTFATLPDLVQVPPLTTSFSLPFRLASTEYAVALDYDGPGDSPGHVPAASRTTTSFDVISSTQFPSGNTVRCIVTYYGNP